MTAILSAFLVFVAIGTPIAFALGAAAAIGLWLLEGVPMSIVASRTFGAIDSFTYLAIPFFILAGELMETGGISRRLIAVATGLVGHLRGGLGNVVVVAMMLFSGISGSTNADAAAVGAVMIPSMKERGYTAARAGAIVAAAAGMGILVPPCLTMVVYGSVTNTSIAALFAAGFLPAFVMAGALMIQLRIEERRSGIVPEPRLPWRERLRAVRGAAWALLLPVIIFGGILGGLFTPTEAAVVAVAYAAIAGGFLYREITPAFLARALVRSGVATGAVMLMIAGANILAWLMAVEGVPQALAGLIASVGGGRTVFMILSILVFLVLFALLDGIPGMLMLIPVFVPIARELGIDLLHYGTVMTTVMGIALFTPPLGVGLYIILGISGATLPDLSRHLLPYLLTMLVVALVIAFVPILVFAIPAALGLHSLT
ncbi:TRAP transporter large permease [Muricoccus aerilatus]|uniref:TRAP transporter large permease n=1 Tax=Muricoccus aerilatus TaxID=452982 RepID=UPI0005C17F7C|nr:TRAP transporter large permease [Roseomonas aerilata]